MDTGAGFQPPSTHTARDPQEGYDLYTYAVTCMLRMMENSFLSFYWISQFCFMPINHCRLLETLSTPGFHDPALHYLPFTYMSPSFSAALHWMACPKVWPSVPLSFLLAHSPGDLLWTPRLWITVLYPALTSPLSPAFLSPAAYVASLLTCLIRVTSYIVWIKHNSSFPSKPSLFLSYLPHVRKWHFIHALLGGHKPRR